MRIDGSHIHVWTARSDDAEILDCACGAIVTVDPRDPATYPKMTPTFTGDARHVFHVVAATRNGSVGYLMGRLAWSGPRVRRALRELEAAGAIERWRDLEVSARAIYYRPVYAVPVPRPDPAR